MLLHLTYFFTLQKLVFKTCRKYKYNKLFLIFHGAFSQRQLQNYTFKVFLV